MYRREIQCRSNKAKTRSRTTANMCISCYLYCNSWTRFTVFLFAYHAVIVYLYINRAMYSTVGISEKWDPFNEVPLETLRGTTYLEAIHYCQRNCVCTIYCMMVCVVCFNFNSLSIYTYCFYVGDMRICVKWWQVDANDEWNPMCWSVVSEVRHDSQPTAAASAFFYESTHTHTRTHIYIQHTQHNSPHTTYITHTHNTTDT